MLKKIRQHKIITGIILLLIISGGYFGYRGLTKNKNTVRYVSAAVEKGTLIVSVSGNGQVSVLDQVDIKPKVSGELAALDIKKDQEVKAGQLVAALNSKNAQQAIRDAQAALDSAKVKIEELLSQPDTKSLLQAENALSQAERDLAQAKENYEETKIDSERSLPVAYEDLAQAKENYDEIKIEAERSLVIAYEDGYSAVSTAFFKLSDYINDLQNVLGTEQNTEEYIGAYKLILGSESPFIQKLLDDYSQADDLFDKSFAFFREVSKDDGRDTIYQVINNTLQTTKTISQALESGRHMFDAIVVRTYQRLNIASQIDKMQPKIESDVSAIYSNLSALQHIQDTIDDVNKNTPKKIKDAQLAIESAQRLVDDTKRHNPTKIREAELAIEASQEKLAEKKLALDELKAGADPQEIKSQKNIIIQKEEALLDAKKNLAECFIRAPLSGVVAKVDVKNGDSVSSGTTLATLVTKQKIAEISLNEIDIAKVNLGQKATITFDAINDLNLTGEVAEIDTLGTITQGVVTYNVKIAFDPVRGPMPKASADAKGRPTSNGVDAQDERVKPGMSLSVAIITDTKQNALLVPNSAIKQQGDLSYVQVVAGPNGKNGQLTVPTELNKATANISGSVIPAASLRTQSIQIGLANDTMTEILDGLKEGERIITQTITANSEQNQSQQNTGFSLPGMPSGGSQMRQMMR